MEYAAQRMRANRIHLLLVTDENNAILGLITSTDIEGEKPLIQISKRRVRRSEITVADIMTPRERLEVIDMADVLSARVGHVVATLKAVGRQHAMVIDRDESGRSLVRGLFSLSQLNRQLARRLKPLRSPAPSRKSRRLSHPSPYDEKRSRCNATEATRSSNHESVKYATNSPINLCYKPIEHHSLNRGQTIDRPAGG